MIKKILYIFIPFLAVLLMSHNVGAVSPVINLDNYTNFSSARSPSIRCYYSDNTSDGTCVGNYFVSSDSTVNKLITSFDLSPAFPNGQNFVANDIVEFDLTFYSVSTLSDAFRFGIVSTLSQSGNFVLLSWEETQNNAFLDAADSGAYSFVLTYHFVFMAKSDVSNSTFAILSSSNRPFNLYESFNGLNGYRLVLTNYNCWRKNDVNDTNAEQKEATEDAADESESQAESSGSNAGTTNLINGLGNVFSAIANTPAGSCSIDANLGNLDLGQINLCQGKDNFNGLIEFIGYSSMFLVIFWAAYHVVTRTLRLIDWARS